MNSVQLIGRLGADPELRHTQSGKAVCNLRMAISNGRDRDATWLDVVCWDRTAELVAQYKGKGDEVAVEGRLQVREWRDKDGNNRKSVEVVAFRVHFIGPKSDGGERQERGGGYSGGGYSGGAPKGQAKDDLDDLPF